ncbi:precorrin-2 dehydrogenase/sirohydrochlorin ferrochelatase family protein [Parapontixanthobacter aurantiacus]
MTIRSLPLFHRIEGRKVVLVGEGAMAEAKRRLIERAGGIPVSEAEAHHAHLAFVAIEGEARATRIATGLKRAGLLVNVADMPNLCDFTTPSICDRDPVLIAIGTGGASAGLAKHLRLRLELLLPRQLGRLASGLSDARDALRRRFPDGDARRQALDAALGEGGTLDPFDDGAIDKLPAFLEGAGSENRPETFEIRLSSHDPEELTLRQARLLGRADTIFHDDDVPAEILARARADAVRRPSGHRPTDPDDEPDGLTLILRSPKS